MYITKGIQDPFQVHFMQLTCEGLGNVSYVMGNICIGANLTSHFCLFFDNLLISFKRRAYQPVFVLILFLQGGEYQQDLG